ncbi:MAG: phenylalanine--tRNA ligase subunit alpha [Euryarchaeota archaeon]|nr:phenylalanine--tRNA ligase subunit alpha [Euryarchaeota archaeon]
MELSRNEKLVLRALGELQEASPGEIARRSGLGESAVNRALYWLVRKGLVELEEREDSAVSLDEEGRLYVERGLPERRALEYLKRRGGEAEISSLGEVLRGEEVRIALGWLRRKNLATISKGRVVLTEEGRRGEPGEDEKLLERLRDGELLVSRLSDAERSALELLRSRQRVVRVEERSTRRARLTEEGRRLLSEGVELEEEISQLTHRVLREGSWRGKKLRGYDVTLPAPEVLPAKLHPLRIIMDEIRSIFLQMGFREISGPLVESSFWNFDALFVPQDHPAREMQDTFYLEEPARAELPDRETVEAVRRAHECGGDTGSTGWRYSWSEEVARTALLRTHTTATTIRYLARRQKPPIKVFCVDRVFRKERITFKHLPEFHQVEGIVVGDVSFADLLGLLREFYSKMGFERVRFRPGYFPYTEPSLEIEVFFQDRGKWLELGGAGIFRPEVTEPLGIRHPVLAWGLGIERLAMLRLGLEDIRRLYMSDITWLRRAKVR